MPTSINDSAHQTKRQGAYWVKRAALFLFAAMVLLLFLRKFFPRAAAVEPVLIGIDDRTVAEFPEPLALWHRHLADLLEALSQARPVAVGIDVVLPAQAYQGNLPGGQQ